MKFVDLILKQKLVLVNSNQAQTLIFRSNDFENSAAPVFGTINAFLYLECGNLSDIGRLDVLHAHSKNHSIPKHFDS